MKLANTYLEALIESKKIKYNMKNVNGGFSGGIDIDPGKTADVMRIAANIYGGSQTNFHSYRVPPPIQKLQDAYIAARKIGDPSGSEIRGELKAYYDNLNRAISLEFVRLIQQFDVEAKGAIDNAVAKLNARYK